MIAGLLAFVTANAAAVLGARAVVARAATGKAATDFLMILILRLLFISATMLVAGVAGLLTPSALGLAGTLALVLLVAFRAHRNLPRSPLPSAGAIGWAFAAAVLARLLLQVWFFSPHQGDALAYHLPKVAEWVRAGGFTREMGLHPHVTFPAGFELIETWWVVFLRHDALIEMAGVEYLVLAFVATYVLAKEVGLGERASFFAAGLYGLTPGLHLGATACLNDAPAAALVVSTAALVLGRVPLPFLLAAAGLGVGTKPTVGFALSGMALLWLRTRRESPRGGRAGLPLGLSLTALAAAVGSFWYMRNALWFGNPFYPLGETGLHNPVAVQLGPSLWSFGTNAADLVNRRIYDDAGPYGANVDGISGWGAPAFACGLVALLAGMAADRRLRRLGAAFLISLAVTLTFSQNDAWCLKYVFFFPAVLGVATARLAEVHRGVRMLAGLALLVSFVGTFLPYDLPLEDFKQLARQPWRERSAAALCRTEARGDAVGCFGGPRVCSYLLYGPEFSRRVVYVRGTTAQALIEDLQGHGAAVLHAVPGPRIQEAALRDAQTSGALRPAGQNLYELRPP